MGGEKEEGTEVRGWVREQEGIGLGWCSMEGKGEVRKEEVLGLGRKGGGAK
jgi:hypothetical protein